MQYGSFAPSDEVYRIGRKISPRSSPPTTKGKGRGSPHRKLCKKSAHRYDSCTSFHPVLHGGDVTMCPSRNRGTHRRRWRETTCARHGESRGGGTGGREGRRRRRLTPRYQKNRRVLPATPAVNAGNSRRARPRGVAVGWRVATVCPVGVWCGALTSHPRPDRTHYGRRRGKRGRE